MWALSGSVSFTYRKVIPFGFTVSGAVSPSAAFAGSRAHVFAPSSLTLDFQNFFFYIYISLNLSLGKLLCSLYFDYIFSMYMLLTQVISPFYCCFLLFGLWLVFDGCQQRCCTEC